SRDGPMGTLDSTHGLAADIKSHHLPAFAFITPNLCHDTHNCGIRTGDDFLATWVPRLADTSEFRDGQLIVFITWGEGEGKHTTNMRNGQPCPRAAATGAVPLIPTSSGP